MAFHSFSTTLFSLFILISVIVPFVHAAPPNNTLYIISNAETPSLRLPGLTPVGLTRVQECLPPLLAPLDIGLIIACPFDPDSGLCKQTEATARPTAEYIGLGVDTSCGADEETDDDCVPDLIKRFGRNSTQSVLIVWDINDLDSLFENLDVDDDWDDNDDDDDDDDDDDVEDELFQHHDVLYTVVKKRVTSIVSQGCAGIDGQAPGTFRRRSLTYGGLRKERKRHRHSEKKSSAQELVEQSEELEERTEETETEEKEGKDLKRNKEKTSKELKLERREHSRVRRRY